MHYAISKLPYTSRCYNQSTYTSYNTIENTDVDSRKALRLHSFQCEASSIAHAQNYASATISRATAGTLIEEELRSAAFKRDCFSSQFQFHLPAADCFQEALRRNGNLFNLLVSEICTFLWMSFSCLSYVWTYDHSACDTKNWWAKSLKNFISEQLRAARSRHETLWNSFA